MDERKLGRLGWINDFFNTARNRLFFRDIDNVLIVPPNQVYKLNKTGIRMLDHLSRGNRIETFPGLSTEERLAETDTFFRAVQGLYQGKETAAQNAAIEPAPYDFSFTRLPILAEIAVTYRCNNRCSFCYLPDGNADTAGDLSTRAIKKIIDIFHDEARVPFFSFTGGEPLIRKDIETLTKYASGKGLTTNLVSNGTLCTAVRAGRLKQAGLGSAQISIEGTNAELHDELTGRPGAFTESLAGISHLQDAGIPVQTNTTLNRKNAADISGLPEFLAERGIRRFAVNLFIPVGVGRTNPQLFLPYSEASPHILTLEREARRLGMTFFWYSPTPYCIFNPLAAGLGNKSCAAADGLLSISPGGDILPCSSYHQPLGNILKDGFKTVWFSSRAAYFKQKHYAPKACSGCRSFTACQGACPLYWDFAGTEELLQGEKHARTAV